MTNSESNPPVTHRSSWWTTLPGLITALAGFLAAVATLVPALKGAGLIGKPDYQPLVIEQTRNSLNAVVDNSQTNVEKLTQPTQPESKRIDSPQNVSTSSQPTAGLMTNVDVPKRSDVSEKVKGLIVALKDASGNSRETALRTLRESLPANLNSQEATALLKNTEANRTNSIGIIAESLAPNQGGDDIALILGDSEGNSREVGLKYLKKAEKIKKSLVPVEAKAILKNMFNNRTNAIGVLAENFAKDLNGDEISMILGEVEGNSREAAIKSLVSAGVIKNNILATEANAVLKNTYNNRANSIAILVGNLAPNQNGEEVAIILGDTEGNSRESALKSLVNAEKIKNNLQALEVVAILKNIGNNRANAVGIIAKNVLPNQNGEGIALILGDTEGNNREVALKSLVKADKIKSNLQSSELDVVLRGMSPPTSALKTLAPFIAK